MKPNQNRQGRLSLLCFGWGNPSLVDSYLKLISYLQKCAEIEPYFITSNPTGKLIFLQKGYQAFTVRELYNLSRDTNAIPIEEKDLKPLLDYELLNQRWLPDEDPTTSLADSQMNYYHWQALRILTAYSDLFNAIQPQAVITWNGAPLFAWALAFLARRKGVPTYFLERGLLPDTLVVDPQGVNYGSHLAGANWEKIHATQPTAEEMRSLRQLCLELQNQKRTIVRQGQDISATDLRMKLGIPPRARTILMPLQIETDSNILSYSPYYKKMADIISDLQKILKNIEEVILLIRPHPEDRSRLAELRSLANGKTRVNTEFSLHSLLALADVVVTVNSTVGLEALLQRKPVVVLGRAIYGEKGFTFDLDHPGQLAEKLQLALQAAETRSFPLEAFYTFLKYLLEHSLFSLSERDPWASRKTIADRIIAAARKTPPATASASRNLEQLIGANQTHLDWLRRPDSAIGLTKPSILLAFPPRRLRQFLVQNVDQAQIQILTRKNAWWRVFPLLVRTYDSALYFGDYHGLPSWVWSLVRAKRKAQLV